MTRTFVEKKWGHEDWLANSPLYCGKDLFIKKENALSLHYHKLKTETFYVLGHIRLAYYTNPDLDKEFTNWDYFDKVVDKHLLEEIVYEDFKVLDLKSGDSFDIPVGMRHYLYAYCDSHVIEFSTQHFDEDSYRILSSSERN